MGRTSSKDPGRSCKGHRLVQLTNIDTTQQRPVCCCGHFAQCKYKPFAQDFLGLSRRVTRESFVFNATKGFYCLRDGALPGYSTDPCLSIRKGAKGLCKFAFGDTEPSSLFHFPRAEWPRVLLWSWGAGQAAGPLPPDLRGRLQDGGEEPWMGLTGKKCTIWTKRSISDHSSWPSPPPWRITMFVLLTRQFFTSPLLTSTFLHRLSCLFLEILVNYSKRTIDRGRFTFLPARKLKRTISG